MSREYNNYVKEALDKAREDALACHQRYIGTEHIVLGILSVESCLAARVLQECGLTYENFLKATLGQSMTMGDVSGEEFKGYSPKSVRILEAAEAEAERFDADEVGTEHILLAILKEQRGGAILPIHKKMAKDPQLLKAFSQQFRICKQEISHIPPQYVELMLMMMGAAAGNAVTIREHGELALKKGATPDEVGEALRLIFFYFGASALIPALELFEELEEM